jgi:hypothetical protein
MPEAEGEVGDAAAVDRRLVEPVTHCERGPGGLTPDEGSQQAAVFVGGIGAAPPSEPGQMLHGGGLHQDELSEVSDGDLERHPGRERPQ